MAYVEEVIERLYTHARLWLLTAEDPPGGARCLRLVADILPWLERGHDVPGHELLALFTASGMSDETKKILLDVLPPPWSARAGESLPEPKRRNYIIVQERVVAQALALIEAGNPVQAGWLVDYIHFLPSVVANGKLEERPWWRGMVRHARKYSDVSVLKECQRVVCPTRWQRFCGHREGSL